MATAGYTISDGTAYRLRLERVVSSIKAYVNDWLCLSLTDTTFEGGYAGLASFGGHNHFDNFLAREWEYSALSNGQTFGDGVAEADVSSQNDTGAYGLGLAFRWQDSSNHYLFAYQLGHLQLVKNQSGTYTTLASVTWPDAFSRMRVRMEGSNFKAYVLDTSGAWVQAPEVTDSAFGAGKIALASHGATNTFDNVLVTDLPGISYTYDYDANGNLTSGSGRTIVWDVENRPTSITYEGQTTSFVYDGDGKRVKKTDAGGSTVYVGSLYEKNLATGVATKYYYAGGRRIAMRQREQVYYLLGDHLGGTWATVKPGGVDLQHSLYYPFGSSRQSTAGLPTDRLFTGQRLDSSTGLYDYGARLYDPALGRFVSPDSLVPQPGNPQSLNRYSYALNNPLKYTDPSGHWVESALDIAFIAFDFQQIATEGWTVENTVALTVDVACLILPVATGGGAATRLAFAAAKAGGGTATHVPRAERLTVQMAAKAAQIGSDIRRGLSERAHQTIDAHSIKRYSEFGSAREAGVDAIHHLVETRFYRQLGFDSKGQAEWNMLAVGIDNATHGPAGRGQLTITDIIRDKISYERSGEAKLQEIWVAHRDAYRQTGHDDWAELIWEAYFQGKQGVVKD